MLQYEALSLAVAQLHMQTQAGVSLPSAAVSSAQPSQQSMPGVAQQQLPYAVGSGRDSPSHLAASRQPEKAHEPMFGAAQPQTEAANAQGTSALLQVWLAGNTVHAFTHCVRNLPCVTSWTVSSSCRGCLQGTLSTTAVIRGVVWL